MVNQSPDASAQEVERIGRRYGRIGESATTIAQVSRELDLNLRAGSGKSRSFIEHTVIDDPIEPRVDYRFGPFTTEEDAHMAVKAIQAVATQVASRMGWEVVTERITRTTVPVRSR